MALGFYHRKLLIIDYSLHTDVEIHSQGLQEVILGDNAKNQINPIRRSSNFLREGSHGALNPVLAPKGIRLRKELPLFGKWFDPALRGTHHPGLSKERGTCLREAASARQGGDFWEHLQYLW